MVALGIGFAVVVLALAAVWTLRRRAARRAVRPPSVTAWIAARYECAAGARDYKLFVPRAGRGRPRPLLVMLHGCAQDADDFAAGTAMNELAERDGFLVVYPEQSRRANSRGCWNWFRAGHQERERGEPAILAGITREVMARHDVDAARVYVAGMSAGGAMALVLAATHPELYAAVGVHSGVAYKTSSSIWSAWLAMQAAGHDARAQAERLAARGARATPLVVFHGARDRVARPDNAEQIVAQWLTLAARGGVELRRFDDGGGGWRRARWCDADGGVVVERWLVDELGHAWSGGRPEGSFTDGNGPSASVEMARFFAGHARAVAPAGASARD